MAMQPYFREIPIVTSQEAWTKVYIPIENPGTGPASYPRWDINTTYSTSFGGYVTLASVLTSPGNYRDPTDHGYTKIRNVFSHGTSYSGDPNVAYTVVKGQVPGAYASADQGDASDDVAYNQALSRQFDIIRAGVDLSVTFAEMGSVKRMIKDVTKVTRYIRSFHPKRWGRKWLEYQYGWRPLVTDIYRTAELILNYASKEGVQKVRTRGSDQVSKSESQPYPAKGRTVTTSSARCEIISYWDLRETDTITASNFTSLNPVNIAWELVPYSFVVDWFYDVGGYLHSMETAYLNRMRFKRGQFSFGRKTMCQATYSFSQQLGSYRNSVSCSAESEYSSFRRRSLAEVPFPRAPSFNVKLGSQQLLSAASLLSLHLKGAR
jgi:hypothetical protein